MELSVFRTRNNGNATEGKLYINGEFQCYTLEDEPRENKVMGETRIPAGRYRVRLRTEGGHHQKYAAKFGFHKGMLHVTNIPNFEYVLIHIGNTEKDTAGCILVGKSVENYVLHSSTVAYIDLYQKVIGAFDKDELVFITIKDEKNG